MKLNKQAIRTWVERLRDPNSKQRRDILGSTYGERCCLGVACDIAVENGVIPAPTPREGVLYYDGESTYLPERVREWFGFDSDNPEMGNRYPNATYLNDNLEWTFPQIADVIEKHYLSDDESADGS